MSALTFLKFVHLLFKKYEFGPSNTVITSILLLGTPGISSILFLCQLSPSVALSTAFLLFYLSILLWILLYRVSPWHPLAKYPGPFFAKATQLYLAYLTSKGKSHIILKEWHELYGPYVRIGKPVSFIFATMDLINKQNDILGILRAESALIL